MAATRIATRTSSMVPVTGARVIKRTTNTDALAKQVSTLKQAQFWEMYDTLIVSANAVAPAAAAFNFANFTINPIPFFNVRSVGNAGPAITSMNQPSILDYPFKAYGVGIEVHCDIDAPTAGAQATAQAFVETVTMYGALEIKMGGDTQMLLPVSDAPAGGGVYYGPRTDKRADAATQLNGSASNGKPSVQARVYWPAPLLFKAAGVDGFNVNLYIGGLTVASGALARIAALTPLAGNVQAMIRVKFWGWRGKSLAPGTAVNG